MFRFLRSSGRRLIRFLGRLLKANSCEFLKVVSKEFISIYLKYKGIGEFNARLRCNLRRWRKYMWNNQCERKLCSKCNILVRCIRFRSENQLLRIQKWRSKKQRNITSYWQVFFDLISLENKQTNKHFFLFFNLFATKIFDWFLHFFMLMKVLF